MTASARNWAPRGRIGTGRIWILQSEAQIRDRLIERCETRPLVSEIAAGPRFGTAAQPPRPHYCAIQPPSTAIGSPVTNDDASEHSHITASAISSGLPIRPTGSAASRSFSV